MSVAQSLPIIIVENQTRRVPNWSRVVWIFFNAVAQKLGLFWMQKLSKQIHYFYKTFIKIKHSAWHWDMTIILKKTLPLSKPMTWCILGAGGVANLFWKSAGSWSLPGKAVGFPMVRDMGEHHRAFPSQGTSGTLCGCTQGLPALCPAPVQGLEGWAGGSWGLSHLIPLSRLGSWAAQSRTPQMETGSAFFTQHFRDFHVVLNSWTRTYNPK